MLDHANWQQLVTHRCSELLTNMNSLQISVFLGFVLDCSASIHLLQRRQQPGARLHQVAKQVSNSATYPRQSRELLLWLQLGNVHLDNEAADMNVSAVASAAVDIAATALDSALLSVERTVERSQQKPEVMLLALLYIELKCSCCTSRHGNEG